MNKLPSKFQADRLSSFLVIKSFSKVFKPYVVAHVYLQIAKSAALRTRTAETKPPSFWTENVHDGLVSHQFNNIFCSNTATQYESLLPARQQYSTLWLEYYQIFLFAWTLKRGQLPGCRKKHNLDCSTLMQSNALEAFDAAPNSLFFLYDQRFNFQ